MIGHRPSSLPIARFCAKAPELSELGGSGRAAMKGKAFHAFMAASEDAKALLAQLEPEEREEILSWHKPKTIVLDVTDRQIVLDYDSAEKEARVGLTRSGEHCEPGDPNALTEGSLDMAWIRDLAEGRFAYVGDIKKTQWTTSEGPDSLQLHVYGMAYASKHDCDGYVTGIWHATEGTWAWGKPVLLELGDERCDTILRDIVHAATNKPGKDNNFATGAHCRNCYGRFHCPAQTFTKEQMESSLALIAPGMATSQNVAEAYLFAQWAEDIIKKTKSLCKDFAERHEVKDPHTGKVLRQQMKKGRVSVDATKLETQYPEVYQDVAKLGAPYPEFRWVKP